MIKSNRNTLLEADAMMAEDLLTDMELPKDFNQSFDNSFTNSFQEDTGNQPTLSYDEIINREVERLKSLNDPKTSEPASLVGIFSKEPKPVAEETLFPQTLPMKIKRWVKTNPGETLLIAGLTATCGYFFYKTLASDKEKQPNRELSGIKKVKRKKYSISEDNEEYNSVSEPVAVEKNAPNDSIKKAGLSLLCFFGGGVAGTAIGEQSVIAGIPLTLYGLYQNNPLITWTGVGMALSSFLVSLLKKKGPTEPIVVNADISSSQEPTKEQAPETTSDMSGLYDAGLNSNYNRFN